MAYYDSIAKQWHRITGYRGGPLKELLLNEAILSRCPEIGGLAILELGAGNGYFVPLLLQRFSGRLASRIVVTDQSSRLLEIAQRHFRIQEAEYRLLDVRSRFPFSAGAFDLLLATMVFNEVSDRTLSHALTEAHRVLKEDGKLIATVLHPAFVTSLSRRRLLKRDRKGGLTMPGSDGLQLPVVKRSVSTYRNRLDRAGFDFDADEVFPTEKLLSAKPALKRAGDVPIGLVFDCHKKPSPPPSSPVDS